MFVCFSRNQTETSFTVSASVLVPAGPHPAPSPAIYHKGKLFLFHQEQILTQKGIKGFHISHPSPFFCLHSYFSNTQRHIFRNDQRTKLEIPLSELSALCFSQGTECDFYSALCLRQLSFKRKSFNYQMKR